MSDRLSGRDNMVGDAGGRKQRQCAGIDAESPALFQRHWPVAIIDNTRDKAAAGKFQSRGQARRARARNQDGSGFPLSSGPVPHRRATPS